MYSLIFPLEHRASVKRIISLQFLNLVDSRTPWLGDQPCHRAATCTGQHKHRINADSHALSGIRTHDPNIRAGEDSSFLRLRGCCDRHSHTRILLLKYVEF
jgi:hypothetical protein